MSRRAPIAEQDARLNGRQQRRIDELDGLRALAILPVMMVHFSPESGVLRFLGPYTHFGGLGVDLFFVLSGFLITGILIEAVGTPHYYRNFMVRRALRIFPLYYAVLTVLFAGLYLASDQAGWRSLREWGHPAWFYAYAGNIQAAIRDRFPPVFSLVPLWSLQVEEQYYLLYPFIVSQLRVFTLKRLLVCCVIAAPILRIAVAGYSDMATRMLMPCRMDSLALGGLIAIAARARPDGLSTSACARWLGASVCAAAAYVIAARFVDTSLPTMSSLAISIPDCVLAALVALVIAKQGAPAVRWLRWRPLVYTGQISYGLYLLHIPAAFMARALVGRIVPVEARGTTGILVSLAAAFSMAALSWRLFEQPILSFKDRLTAAPLPSEQRVATMAGVPTDS